VAICRQFSGSLRTVPFLRKPLGAILAFLLWPALVGAWEPPRAAEQVLERGGGGLGAAALGDASYPSIAACVDAHVAAAGDQPLRVRKLDCALPAPEECSGAEPDLSPLARLPNLLALDLAGRCIRSVAPLGSLTKLRRLELAHNAIGSIRELAALGELRYLGLAANPVQSTWMFSNREPFSALSQLEELVLDDTEVDNILPLAQAKALRRLSLRRTLIYSLRPLVALRKLRALHVDGNLISELSALSAMTQLEELTAESSFIQSVAPLVPLVSRQLRRIALRENCVASCDALQGSEYDCSERRPSADCQFHPERDAPAWYNGVPVHLVEQFAPADLPAWTREQLTRAFELVRAAPHIDWKHARGNCDGRAAAAEELLRQHDFPPFTRATSFGNLRMLSANDPLGYLMFDWHVAVAVRVQFDDGTSGFAVIDPALNEAGPLHVRDWFARQVDSADSALDFSCLRYHAENPSQCTRSLMVDADGNFLVDPLSLVRGTICAPGNVCLP
jgi:hypothetical protein